jgi:6-phosphogluconolactonase
MPASDGLDGSDLEAAAARHAADLAAAAGQPGRDGGVPTLDVVLLGMGPDGHVASVFPGHPAVVASGTVVGVRDAPKPPSQRITLTLPTLCQAREVWLLVAGAAKAAAVATALRGQAAGTAARVPAGRVRGRSCTLWLLDRAAAGLPQ